MKSFESSRFVSMDPTTKTENKWVVLRRLTTSNFQQNRRKKRVGLLQLSDYQPKTSIRISSILQEISTVFRLLILSDTFDKPLTPSWQQNKKSEELIYLESLLPSGKWIKFLSNLFFFTGFLFYDFLIQKWNLLSYSIDWRIVLFVRRGRVIIFYVWFSFSALGMF